MRTTMDARDVKTHGEILEYRRQCGVQQIGDQPGDHLDIIDIAESFGRRGQGGTGDVSPAAAVRSSFPLSGGVAQTSAAACEFPPVAPGVTAETSSFCGSRRDEDQEMRRIPGSDDMSRFDTLDGVFGLFFMVCLIVTVAAVLVAFNPPVGPR